MNEKLNKFIFDAIHEIEAKEKKTQASWSWTKVKATKQECFEAFKVFLDRQTGKRNPGEKFVIDLANTETIEQLVAYMTGSPDFNGNHNKGIMLVGQFGTGKTTIMNALCDFYFAMSKRIIINISAVELTAAIRKKSASIDEYTSKPLFIDEIGRETESVKDYGTEIRPIPDIIGIRYSRGALTFASSNFVVEKQHAKGGACLEDKYGLYVADRMREMFNILVMKGESRRR